MRKLIHLAAALALCVAVAGCGKTVQTIENAWNVVTKATIEPKVVLIAADTFNGIEATATVYLRQARCAGPAKPTCRDPGITRQIKPAILQGRKARDAMIAFLEAHPGELGDKGLYDALQLAIGTVQGIFKTYGIGEGT